MALYELQKMVRDVNTKDDVRRAYFADPAAIMARYELSEAEREALRSQDYGQLYRMGIHGLLLRPFSILHAVAEQDYLAAIRSSARP